jgi:hypothetical protein
MGSSHRGLNQMILDNKKLNKDFAKALKGKSELVLFLNAKRTACKLFRENGTVLGYLRLQDGMIAGTDEIDEIADEFGGSLEYSQVVIQALKDLGEVEAKYKQRRWKKTSRRGGAPLPPKNKPKPRPQAETAN